MGPLPAVVTCRMQFPVVTIVFLKLLVEADMSGIGGC